MRASKSGATQAGVRQVGEIGEANDEQRIAIVPLSGGHAAAGLARRPLRLRI